MKLKKLPYNFSICKIPDLNGFDLSAGFYFIGRTDEEISLVCRTEDAPAAVMDKKDLSAAAGHTDTSAAASERDDGWKGFRFEGILDFSLTGILAGISKVLAEAGIGIFAVSTYNTDYIFVKEENSGRAETVLKAAGYEVTGEW